MNEYNQVSQTIQSIIDRISPYASEETLSGLQRIDKNFSKKIEDFYQENRKLNIGVIGRVKAGKSSFLNTLLFGGEEILPKAATPKTAALTKMEYSETNRVVIEFYTPEEWEGIESDARLGDKNEITRSAKELVDMARNRGLYVPDILSKGNLDRTFGEYQELLQFLNDYVGENGTYTPLVRSVVIYMNREEFKDISIVDTPGLNDPIPSRTQRTKEFIEVCDVVFFLSRAGSFLDVNDWELLCKQLPQKGVKKMVLVASQYDGGLRDVLKKPEKKQFFGKKPDWKVETKSASKADNLPDARKIVASSLERRVKEKISSFEAKADMGSHDMILKILKECEKPVLVSARAQDMSRKDPKDYSPEEKADYEFWKGFLLPEQMKEEFASIGNFHQIEEIYGSIKDEKKRILEERRRGFIPTVYIELNQYLRDLLNEEEKRLEYLKTNNQDSVEMQQRFFQNQINGIKADVAEVFGDTLEKIKMQKQDINRTLREMSLDAAKLETRTGTEVHYETNVSYKFKLGPIKLGREVSYDSYTTTYTYLAASDALEQITAYGKHAASAIEEVFCTTVELKTYRRRLLETVARNFDTGDKDFDVNYFRIVVQNILNRIDFPEVHIDVSKELEEIGNEFSGEIRRDSDQDRFRRALSKTVEKLYVSIQGKVDVTISDFQKDMWEHEIVLCDNILEKVLKEFETLKQDMANKEREKEKGEGYVQAIKDALSEMRS